MRIFYLSFSLILTGCFTVKNNCNFTYEKLDAKTYVAMLHDSSSFCLIDVRTAKEYQRSHIPGAVNISYLNFHYGRDVDTIPRDKLVFVYCHTCHRSPLAARKMKRKGFRKVYDLKEGFKNSPWNRREQEQ